MASRIPGLLARYGTLSPPAASAGASVLIVLRDGPVDVEVLLIERSIRAGDPASGHVALPGGHVDPADADLAAAALRELSEEVGLASSDLDGPVRHVATLDARRFGLRVGVFAGALAGGSTTEVRGDPREVAATFWLPLDALRSTTEIVEGASPAPLPIRGVRHQGHLLWGFTLRVLELFTAPAEATEGRPAQAGGPGAFGGGGVHGASSHPS